MTSRADTIEYGQSFAARTAAGAAQNMAKCLGGEALAGVEWVVLPHLVRTGPHFGWFGEARRPTESRLDALEREVGSLKARLTPCDTRGA